MSCRCDRPKAGLARVFASFLPHALPQANTVTTAAVYSIRMFCIMIYPKTIARIDDDNSSDEFFY
jgi:hypothetical protein